jgi:hypothetical protein
VTAPADLVPLPRPPGRSGASIGVADVALGASATIVVGGVNGIVAVSRRVGVVGAPVVRVVLRPPLVPAAWQPGTWLTALSRRGAEQRALAEDAFSRLLDVLVPIVLVEVLQRIDLTTVVKQYVDLDAVVAGVDLDAVAARIDVDAVAGRLDVLAVVNRIDLTALVQERVDLDAIVGGVDLDAVAARLDVEAIIKRLDLGAIAEEVIAAIDLPEIIRESTGSMASETVRGARMQGIAADEAVGRAVDRLLLRRGRRSTQAPSDGSV